MNESIILSIFQSIYQCINQSIKLSKVYLGGNSFLWTCIVNHDFPQRRGLNPKKFVPDVCPFFFRVFVWVPFWAHKGCTFKSFVEMPNQEEKYHGVFLILGCLQVYLFTSEAKKMAEVKQRDRESDAATCGSSPGEVMSNFQGYDLVEMNIPEGARPRVGGTYLGKHGYTLKNNSGAATCSFLSSGYHMHSVAKCKVNAISEDITVNDITLKGICKLFDNPGPLYQPFHE